MRGVIVGFLVACVASLGVLLTECGAEPYRPPAPCLAPNASVVCNPSASPAPTATPSPSPSPTPTALPSSGHIDVWVNDDFQNGGVNVPAPQVQAFATYAENQLQGETGKAFTDCAPGYTGGNISSNVGYVGDYAGGHSPSWCDVIAHEQFNAMPAGAESGSTCTGLVGRPFKTFYTMVAAGTNGLSEANAVLHGSGSASVTTRINKGFGSASNPQLGCNGSSNNFLNNYGTAAVRQAALVCQDTIVGDAIGSGTATPFPGPTAATGSNAQTMNCDVGFDLAKYAMYDNNHVTQNRTCAQCGWTSSIEGVSDNNYSGGVGNSGFCASNLCTAADLGTTLDHNHALLYNNNFHRDGVTPWKLFINQMQDSQTSNNVTPRCTDLIGGFNNGSNNVVLIQNEDAFEDTGNDETRRYNPWQWAFALNSESCVLYNGVNNTTMAEVHQVDDYLTGCSGGVCSQTTINNNRMTYLGLLWLYFEPGRTPVGEQVVQNGGSSSGDHNVLSSFPEDFIFPAGPLESMSMYTVPQGSIPGQDGSGCSRLDTLSDGGAVGLLVDALHSGGPQNSVTCGWSNTTVVHSGDGTNNNKAVGMYARQFVHCYQYVATMAQAIARTGTWTDRGKCASIVLAAQSTGANNQINPNTANSGQVVPCNTSVGNNPFVSGGVGDFTQYTHMMTLATFSPAGGFMGVSSNSPGLADVDTNFSRANGPNDANVTGAAFVCYNGSNAGSATVIPGGQAFEIFQ